MACVGREYIRTGVGTRDLSSAGGAPATLPFASGRDGAIPVGRDRVSAGLPLNECLLTTPQRAPWGYCD